MYVFHEDSTKANVGGSPGNYAYTTFATVSRLDGRYLDTSQPIFTYFDADNSPLATPITTTPASGASTRWGSTSVSACGRTSPVVVISTLIHVRNVDYNPNFVMS